MMKKRDFLTRSALIGLAPVAPALAAEQTGVGPGLLTVSGAISQSNRGPLDPALDQMMVKHGISFDKAMVFDSAALLRLRAVQIKPTLEYDGKQHVLVGPLLGTVLTAAGVNPMAMASMTVGLRAVDGYNVNVPFFEVLRMRMMVATHMDGTPMALGGLGPQWAIFDADNVVPFKDQPVKDRFALCPWGLYHISVGSA